MNIIDIYDKLKNSYKNYIGSFVSIKDERIKQRVSEAIQNEKLWPKALVQFNPNFAQGLGVSQFGTIFQDSFLQTPTRGNRIRMPRQRIYSNLRYRFWQIPYLHGYYLQLCFTASGRLQ